MTRPEHPADFEAHFEHSPVGFGIVDRDFRYLRVNASLAQLNGVPIEQHAGRTVAEVLPGLWPKLEPHYRAALAGKTLIEQEVIGPVHGRGDELRDRLARYFPIRHADAIVGVGLVVTDVTEAHRIQEALHIRDRAINAIGQGVCITDPRQDDNPIIFASPGFERLTGYSRSEVVGRNCRFLQGPDTDPASTTLIRNAVAKATSCTVELLNYRKDGLTFWNALTLSPVVDDTGTLTHFVGVQVDVSERRELEARLHTAERMEAVGHLARGVAHDFNNLLTVIGGWSDVLQTKLAVDSPSHEPVLEIRRCVERASAITRQLVAFTEPHSHQPLVIDLNVLINESVATLRRVLGEGIRLAIRTTRRVWPTRVDAEVIEQILIGIASLVHDGMPTGGAVTITTGLISGGTPPTGIPPGDYVTIEVIGNGATEIAVPEDRIEALRTDMRTLGGYATIAPATSGEIAIQLYIPREAVEPRGESASAPRTLPTGSETILLVEDEASLRSLSCQVLQACGYTVMEAGNGVEALDIIRSYRGRIDLVISDVVMPHLGGRRLAEALRAARPDGKILFMSGYTDDEVVRHGIDVSQVAFLPKPFASLGLARAVRGALDQAQPRLPAQR